MALISGPSENLFFHTIIYHIADHIPWGICVSALKLECPMYELHFYECRVRFLQQVVEDIKYGWH